VPDSAALAAHYGSVSVVTFVAALAFLDAAGTAYEGFLPALVAIMEVPAIAVAIVMARAAAAGAARAGGRCCTRCSRGGASCSWPAASSSAPASGPAGLARVAPVFVDPFQGVLVLFLLEMGMVAARRLREVRSAGVFLVAFGVGMPVLNGAVGAWVGSVVGLSLGGSTVLGVLAASASYIAAPAAVRVALPEANPGLYLSASLAITFPFNLAVGIPLCYAAAQWAHSHRGGFPLRSSRWRSWARRWPSRRVWGAAPACSRCAPAGRDWEAAHHRRCCRDGSKGPPARCAEGPSIRPDGLCRGPGSRDAA
jgi:hypothetical protein